MHIVHIMGSAHSVHNAHFFKKVRIQDRRRRGWGYNLVGVICNLKVPDEPKI